MFWCKNFTLLRESAQELLGDRSLPVWGDIKPLAVTDGTAYAIQAVKGGKYAILTTDIPLLVRVAECQLNKHSSGRV